MMKRLAETIGGHQFEANLCLIK